MSRASMNTNIVQKRAAPMSPKSPAMPKVETEEPTVAEFVLLALLPLADDVVLAVAVCEALIHRVNTGRKYT